MHRITHRLILSLIAVPLLSGCSLWPGSKSSGKGTANARPRSTPLVQGSLSAMPDPKPVDTSALQTTPIVEYWDNGNFLNNRPSELLFAVWQDGKVMRLLNGRAYFGYISNLEVSRLMERLARAGVESIPFTNGVIFPDGPSQLLYIDVNGIRILMRHDSRVTVDDLDNYDFPANVTRPQLMQFMDVWGRAEAALDDVWPLHLDLTTGIPAIPYPSAGSTEIRVNQ